MTNEALKAALDAVSDEMPTHELMSWLNDVERDRFVKLQETFETPGWKLIVEYANAQVIQHGIAGANAASWDDCLLHRGERVAWDRVAKLDTEFMNAFHLAAQEAQQRSADEVMEE